MTKEGMSVHRKINVEREGVPHRQWGPFMLSKEENPVTCDNMDAWAWHYNITLREISQAENDKHWLSALTREDKMAEPTQAEAPEGGWQWGAGE